jgi:predicted DNA-binding transcriptional regulator AlpA
MSIEEQFAEVVRKVVREELALLSNTQDLELLTADDVAKLLKYPDRHSVYKLKREGKLKPVSLGDRTLRFSQAEVRRFIQECAE